MLRLSRWRAISLGNVPPGSTARKLPPPPHSVNRAGMLTDATGKPISLQEQTDAETMQRWMDTVYEPPRTTPGAKPRRYYVNRFTAFFFEELDKGVRSPWVVGIYVAIAAAALAKLVRLSQERTQEEYEERQRLGEAGMLRSRTQYKDSHNLVFGIKNANVGRGTVSGMGRFDSPDVTDERPPALIHAEKSEALGSSSSSSVPSPAAAGRNDTDADGDSFTPADIVVIEKTEYDSNRRSDVFYRTLQYIYADDVSQEAADAKELKKYDGDVEEMKKARAKEAATRSSKGNSSNGGSGRSKMDIPKEDHIHGSVKCIGIDSQNNCVPVAGHVELEEERKFMLGLPPVHLVRDVEKVMKRLRVTYSKDVESRILMLGLRAGENANVFRHFPNFTLDIVEKDPAIVRINKTMLGFRELENWTMTIMDPVAYVKRAAVDYKKRYDYVVIDGLDGKGRLSTAYSRLEFVDAVRTLLDKTGVAAVNIPNDDPHYLYQFVQNWRMGFENKLVLLFHCATSQNTLMLAFQDNPDRGKAKMGTVGSISEFRDIVHNFLSYYNKVPLDFDLSSEVQDRSFRIVEPGRRYSPEYFLPVGHPALRDSKFMRNTYSWGDATGTGPAGPSPQSWRG